MAGDLTALKVLKRSEAGKEKILHGAAFVILQLDFQSMNSIVTV